MANEMIWAYLVHLSNHWWDDPLSAPRGPYMDPAWKDDNDIDMDVWDQVMQALGTYQFNTVIIDVCDAVQYDSHPEISAPDAWSKDFMKKKLDEIRALGITPIPKLNFSTCHDAWMKEYGRMVSTPKYYQVVADVIREVCEVFDYPRYFHLGMDEETDKNQNYCDIAVIRHMDMWVHDLHFMVSECAKHGARPIIWGDMIRRYPELFEKQVSREILMAPWYYGRFYHPWEEATIDPMAHYGPNFFRRYEKLGFDQLLTCSTLNYKRNPQQTMGFAKNEMDPAKVKGFLTACWQPVASRVRYALLHDAEGFYFARKVWYPETLKQQKG